MLTIIMIDSSCLSQAIIWTWSRWSGPCERCPRESYPWYARAVKIRVSLSRTLYKHGEVIASFRTSLTVSDKACGIIREEWNFIVESFRFTGSLWRLGKTLDHRGQWGFASWSSLRHQTEALGGEHRTRWTKDEHQSCGWIASSRSG